MSKPRTFQELATNAYDMEMMIANRHSKPSSLYEFKKDKGDSKKSSKLPKASMKETMTISTEEPVRISGKSRPEGKKTSFSKETTKRSPTLKELQEKKYPFPDSDLLGMLDDLFENKIIELPEPKRPEEVGRTYNPKCCRYHRVISHPLKKALL